MNIISLQPFHAGLVVGDAGKAIIVPPDERDSGPRGVESTIEFNGLYLNVRSWLDTFIITSIDGLGDADVRDARELNPQQHGETYFDAFYGGRTIVLTGYIRAQSIFRLRDMQQGLRQAFADLTKEHALIFRTGNPSWDMQLMCKKSQPISMAEAQNNFQPRRDFQITLRASNPRFLSVQREYQQRTGVGSLPLINKGNFQTQPEIRISNAITDPTVTFPNGQVLKFDGSILEGEEIIVDIATRRITDQTGANRFGLLDATSNWPELDPGSNVITFSGDSVGVNTTLTTYHHHAWI